MPTNTFSRPPWSRFPPSIDRYLRTKPRKEGSQETKCPKCGFEMVLPDMSKEDFEDEKLVEELEEATLTEFEADEKWRQDHAED